MGCWGVGVGVGVGTMERGADDELHDFTMAFMICFSICFR